MNRIRFVKHIVGAALLAASAATFAGEVPFTQASFDQTVSSGRPAVVYLHATWCPTCRVQKPIVDRLSADPKLKQVTIFIADYDAETKLKRAEWSRTASSSTAFMPAKRRWSAAGSPSTWASARPMPLEPSVINPCLFLISIPRVPV